LLRFAKGAKELGCIPAIEAQYINALIDSFMCFFNLEKEVLLDFELLFCI